MWADYLTVICKDAISGNALPACKYKIIFPLKMRKANAARIQNRPVTKEAAAQNTRSCLFLHLWWLIPLLDAGNRVVLCLHGLLQHLIVHFSVQGNDGSTGFVADNSLVYLRQSFQCLLDAGFTVGAHHTFYG